MRITSDISYEKMLTWLKKGNLTRESGFLLITVQNNARMTTIPKQE